MSGRAALSLAVLALAVLVALALGMRLGGHLERQQGGGAERGVVAGVGASSTVALPTLRCTNGDPPRGWSRLEAEARLHTAQMSLRSAEHHGVWTDLGLRWSGLAKAQMMEVDLCWERGR